MGSLCGNNSLSPENAPHQFDGARRPDERKRLFRQMTAISHALPARTNKKAIAGKYFEIAKRFLGIEKEEKHG